MFSVYFHTVKCVKLKHINYALTTKVILRNWSRTPVSNKAVTSSKPLATDVQTICESNVESRNDKPLEATLTSLPQKYLLLSKFKLTSLVVMTSLGGYAMAPAPFELSTVLFCSLGTGLLSCAANAINQFHEVPFDAQMARTRNRLLVRSIVTPLHAVGFAAACALSGAVMLYFGVNGLTLSLGLTNLILYTSVYTPLKRISIVNTWVGSVVGALPPLMGWAGCTGSLESGAWILAGILYAWQFPHFNALSWNLRPDYSRAGYRMMAVTDPDLCRRTTLRYTVAIMALSCAAPLVNLTNSWFAIESVPLNGYFLYLAWKFYKESDSANSRKLFRFSLIHLPALMLLMMINKKSLGKEDNNVTLEEVEDNNL